MNIFLSFLLGIFATSVFAATHTNIDINPYVKEFEKLSQKKVIGVTAKEINNLHYTQGGFFDSDTNTININPVYWKKHPKFGQEMLVFTFLGHHVLKKEILYDTKEIHTDLCPKSIMHWSLSETCYKRHRKDYHKELFGGASI